MSFQFLTMALLLVLGAGAVAACIAAAAGYIAWLDMPLSFGGFDFPQAGMAAQIAGTVLIVGLLAYLPGNARVLALENSHRRFHLTMQDVTRAYRLAHAADRQGNFNLKSEFDSVRERIAYLRDHPDLAELEAPVIEVAAQMSHLSRDLARVYSEDAVTRARDFLTQRQNELEDFNRRLGEAKAMAVELRSWTEAVEMDEAVAQSQLSRLREELSALLPELQAREIEEIAPLPERAAVAGPAHERDWLEVSEGYGEDEDTEGPTAPDIVALNSRRAAQ
ncbi:DNA repair protein [Roseivivax sp.]